MPCGKTKNDIYFDIQKVHALPVLTIRKTYYKHKQIAYNECKNEHIFSNGLQVSQRHCISRLQFCPETLW